MHSLTSEANINNLSIKSSMEKLDVTESSKKEILRTEMTDKDMPSSKYKLASSAYNVTVFGKKNCIYYSGPEDAPEKKNIYITSCSILPDDISLPTLRTCASFPIISIPRIANAPV